MLTVALVLLPSISKAEACFAVKQIDWTTSSKPWIAEHLQTLRNKGTLCIFTRPTDNKEEGTSGGGAGQQNELIPKEPELKATSRRQLSWRPRGPRTTLPPWPARGLAPHRDARSASAWAPPSRQGGTPPGSGRTCTG
jgi:hypothetical protein